MIESLRQIFEEKQNYIHFQSSKYVAFYFQGYFVNFFQGDWLFELSLLQRSKYIYYCFFKVFSVFNLLLHFLYSLCISDGIFFNHQCLLTNFGLFYFTSQLEFTSLSINSDKPVVTMRANVTLKISLSSI